MEIFLWRVSTGGKGPGDKERAQDSPPKPLQTGPCPPVGGAGCCGERPHQQGHCRDTVPPAKMQPFQAGWVAELGMSPHDLKAPHKSLSHRKQPALQWQMCSFSSWHPSRCERHSVNTHIQDLGSSLPGTTNWNVSGAITAKTHLKCYFPGRPPGLRKNNGNCPFLPNSLPPPCQLLLFSLLLSMHPPFDSTSMTDTP